LNARLNTEQAFGSAMAFCGPKLSLCGIVTSAWGIVQLVS
jgi:hypothetical protein